MAFLREVYASSRHRELELTDWDEAQKSAFIRAQFIAQDRHYRQHYADATFAVVLVGGVPAGRLYVARWPTEIRIIDITLLAVFRGGGVGTRLIRELQAEAGVKHGSVTAHVEQHNPALRLYKRLGFSAVSTHGVHVLMEFQPAKLGRGRK